MILKDCISQEEIVRAGAKHNFSEIKENTHSVAHIMLRAHSGLQDCIHEVIQHLLEVHPRVTRKRFNIHFKNLIL